MIGVMCRQNISMHVHGIRTPLPPHRRAHSVLQARVLAAVNSYRRANKAEEFAGRVFPRLVERSGHE